MADSKYHARAITKTPNNINPNYPLGILARNLLNPLKSSSTLLETCPYLKKCSMHFRWSFSALYGLYFLPGSSFAAFEEVKVPISNSAEFGGGWGYRGYFSLRAQLAERFSASDLCSDGWVVRMWVRILAVTVVLVSLSKTLNYNCFSLPRSINGDLWGQRW